MESNWKRVGNGLVWVVPEDSVSPKVVKEWKRLLKADNDLAHTVSEHRRGAEWATSEALDAARTEMVRAGDNWRALCRVMGWRGRNGRTFPVHLSSSPADEIRASGIDPADPKPLDMPNPFERATLTHIPPKD